MLDIDYLIKLADDATKDIQNEEKTEIDKDLELRIKNSVSDKKARADFCLMMSEAIDNAASLKRSK
jgi:hypothetical protein